ncbi:hypothetical protein BX616_005853 [Lobosporangium transversale]|uniref:ribonuclease Z n=1 Tax=Lobosporangium transversale TaxID=64571 RepID=A0A1Y2GLM6_9FUNG|nr:beta-lactamase-like protein [Lobosporangium transversale]KAF9915565.1 hypothetical protein BX616_005853 [Lobosporangium transversale]ORZ14874.1 beta-lactamase-like protein [Lobosporangium transversale]|eukprot:XP_021881006.1 beta-lactamase-like protein [Lobosporangium transversale]
MKAHLQILSTGTPDCLPSVILHFDTQRYLINCGEGTQRLCLESRFRFSKIKTIFFTRTHWDCLGGTPGMLLTLADLGVSRMKLLGAENLTHAMISTRPFVYRNIMAVDSIEFNKEMNTYMDENLRVTAVQVFPSNFKRAPPFDWPVPSSTAQPQSSFREKETLVTPTAGAKRGSIELQSSSDLSLATPINVDEAQQTRQKILDSMFTLSKESEVNPQRSKKPKLDRDRSSASSKATALTDVDIIEATRSAANAGTSKNNKNSSSSCGPKPSHPGRFLVPPRTSPNAVAISYIFQSPDYVGKFNKQAALDLGVKEGKAFSMLVKGNSVLSKSGETVYPHQVLNGARPGRVVMIIECPTVEYIPSLVSSKEFNRFQHLGSEVEAGTEKLRAECIVHLGGHSVLSHSDYKAWMHSFGPETQHIIANQDYCPQKLIWRSQSISCHRLSKLDPTIFPIPYHNNTPEHDLAVEFEGSPIKVQAAESMLSYKLEPSAGWDRSEVVPLLDPFKDHDVGRDGAKPYLKEYYGLAEKANEEIARDIEANPEVIPGSDVVLTSLGTGSSHPAKYRNVSATLLDMQENGTFLLDGGEGTYGQMFRHFNGYKRSADQAYSVDNQIKNLKGIFVSHLHADHHLGVVTIIDKWNQLRDANSKPMYLIAPAKFNTFLQELSDTQDFGYKNVEFIECEDIVYWRDEFDERRASMQHSINGLLESSGFSEISTVDVIHCPWAYGISMSHKDGWKVVYSGDTRPCENLVEAGQDATVLLHEATFEDDMADLAILKKHSTAREAIMVGEGMNAKYTMLTHFSQRYPKIPQFDSEDKTTSIGICFDLMSVRLGQMERLPKYLPALRKLYSPESDEALEVESEGQDSELQKLQFTGE